MKKMIIMSLMLASMLSFAKKEKIKNKLGLAVKPGVNAAADIRRDVLIRIPPFFFFRVEKE